MGFSAKAIHHVPPNDLPLLFARILGALRLSGCFILYDAMLWPDWRAKVRKQSSRSHQHRLRDAIDAGVATQQEIDARLAFKRGMKAAGKDVEYSHVAEDIISSMTEAGFDEVTVVWRMFADTILMGFTPDQGEGVE